MQGCYDPTHFKQIKPHSIQSKMQTLHCALHARLHTHKAHRTQTTQRGMLLCRQTLGVPTTCTK